MQDAQRVDGIQGTSELQGVSKRGLRLDRIAYVLLEIAIRKVLHEAPLL